MRGTSLSGISRRLQILGKIHCTDFQAAAKCWPPFGRTVYLALMETIEPGQPQKDTDDRRPWWRLLNRYHWFVLAVAALGWLFDTMDQQLFNLARVPAMKALLKPGEEVALYGGYATSIFLIGWAAGGLTFGVLGDRIGRVNKMVWTILIYSL